MSQQYQTIFDKNLFEKLYNLKSLNFSHNEIVIIHEEQFLMDHFSKKVNNNITSIDFSYNFIKKIEKETFNAFDILMY